MVGTSRGRWRWREKIGRRLPSLSSAPARSCPCAFRLNLKPWGRGWFQLTLFTALLHYYLGAWNRLVIRLLFVNQDRLLSRLIWLFHVTYEYLWRPVLVKINMIKLHHKWLFWPVQHLLWTRCVFLSSLHRIFFSVLLISFSCMNYFLWRLFNFFMLLYE